MEKTTKFSIEGVPVELLDEVPEHFNLNDIKDAIKSTWQFSNVKASIPFIRDRWNPLQKAAEKKDVGKTEYLGAQIDNEKYEANNFVSKGVAAAREVTLTLTDRFGSQRKVKLIIGDPKLERLPSFNSLEAYRQLPWTGSDFEIETLNSWVAHNQGGPEPIQNREDAKARLVRVDLKLDKPVIHKLCADVLEISKKRIGEIQTDPGEKVVEAFQEMIPKIEDGFNKAAEDPSISPGGEVFDDGVSDMRLALLLNELAAEAYATLQRRSREKGESFFTLLKQKLPFKPKARAMFPDDYKESSEV